MLIECLIKRAEGTKVQLGDDVYHFFTHIKGKPEHVCEVEDEDHIQTFLAIKEGYRLVKQPKKAAVDTARVEATADTATDAPEKDDAEVKKPAKAK